MKTSKTIYIVSALLGIVLFLSIFKITRHFFLFIAYNSLIVFDRLFLSIGMPLVTYAILFAIIGAGYGVIVASNQLTLSKKIQAGGIIGIIILLFLMVGISNPFKIENMGKIREEALYQQIISTNSFDLCKEYLNDFPKSERADEIRKIQEAALWEIATTTNKSSNWKLYIDMFDSKEGEAQEKYEQTFWKEVLKANTEQEFRRYLAEFKSGKYRKAANNAINRITKKRETNNDAKQHQNNIPIEEDKIVEPVEELQNTINEIQQQTTEVPVVSEEVVKVEDSTTEKPKEEPIEKKAVLRSGTINRGNGITYRGILKDDIPHGKGTEIFPDGSNLKGEWVDGKRHGSFVYTNPKGVRENQEFKDGRRIK